MRNSWRYGTLCLVLLLLCTITISPATAEPTDENRHKIVFGTDNKMYLFKYEDMEENQYFHLIKNFEQYEVSRNDDGRPVIYVPIPPEPKEKSTETCWLLPCANAVAPAVAAVAAATGANAIGDIMIATAAGTFVAVTLDELSKLDNADIIRIAGITIHKTHENFQKVLEDAKTSLAAPVLNKYNFYIFDDLENFEFYGLGNKYAEKNKLSSFNALELMKDCKPPKGKHILIGSTEEGCRTLAELATKILGGHGIEMHRGKMAQPDHVHAGIPDKDGSHQHCKSHCFWNYTDFYGIHGRGGGGSLA